MPAGLPLVANTLVFAYSGDSNYASSTTTLNLTIVNDSLSLGYATSILTGQAYTVTTTINGGHG